MSELTLNEYQKKAARTINNKLTKHQQVDHAVFGLASEAGEISGIFQKVLQGHKVDPEHLKKEMGDVLWFLAELATAYGWDLGDIGELNNKKLEARFPNGFETEKSLNRAKGDI